MQSTAASLGLLLLRVGAGSLMIFGHGLGKLTGFGEMSARFGDPLGLGGPLSLGLAVFAEFFCSLAVALGLFTRLAVIPLIVTMSVAGLVVHAQDPFARKELALLYLVSFVTLLFTGAGRFSIDARMGRG